MALGSTLLLTEMNTRCISCGKGGRLATLQPSCSVVMKYGNLNFLEPSGPLQAYNRTTLPLLLWHYNWNIFNECLYIIQKTRILENRLRSLSQLKGIWKKPA